MLTTSDADIVREVLGDAVYSLEDVDLMTETRIALTGVILKDAVEGAATETDPDRVTMLNAAHAYLVGIDAVAADITVSGSKLADSTLSFDAEDRGRIMAYWRRRYTDLVRRLNGVIPEPISYVVLAHGSRG